MTNAEGASDISFPISATSGPMQSIDRMMPDFSEITFWLVVNVVLFLYVGIFELAKGYGPGAGYSAGAIVLAFIYMLLWMYRRTNKKMADQSIMIISGLAILGDLVVVAISSSFFSGSFSGDSALLDMVGLMLFHSTYKEYRNAT
jgi:hypothetical protein